MTKFQEKVYPVRKGKKVFNRRKNTEFSNGVYQVVAKIPRGQVLTYKQVAQRIGHPLAYRAVGNALNKNRNANVPCHRVIKSDGTVGGFRAGPKKKKALLKKEGAL